MELKVSTQSNHFEFVSRYGFKPDAFPTDEQAMRKRWGGGAPPHTQACDRSGSEYAPGMGTGGPQKRGQREERSLTEKREKVNPYEPSAHQIRAVRQPMYPTLNTFTYPIRPV